MKNTIRNQNSKIDFFSIGHPLRLLVCTTFMMYYGQTLILKKKIKCYFCCNFLKDRMVGVITNHNNFDCNKLISIYVRICFFLNLKTFRIPESNIISTNHFYHIFPLLNSKRMLNCSLKKKFNFWILNFGFVIFNWNLFYTHLLLFTLLLLSPHDSPKLASQPHEFLQLIP